MQPPIPARWWPALRESVLGLVFPPACAACGEEFGESPPRPLLCFACREMIGQGFIAPCRVCAMPHMAESGCTECQRRQHRFTSAVALGKYEGGLRTLVLRMKSGRDEALANALGHSLAEAVTVAIPEKPQIDAVVPIPLPWKRRIFRAANPAELLADAAAVRLGTPCIGLLEFRRNVKQQHNLRPAQRRRNMRHAWAAAATYDIKDAHLLVVDDVLTTGATADEAARALLAAGASRVSVAVVARGIGLD